MYSTKSGTVQATDGTQIELTITTVDIDPELARQVFDQGIVTGAYSWKEKYWECETTTELEVIIRAARFFFGLAQDSEKLVVTSRGYLFIAKYAC